MRNAILLLGLLAAVGTVRADEEKVGLKDVPKAVRAAVKDRFPEGKMTAAAKEIAEGKVVYEIVVTDDDETIDVAVSAKGKILEVEKTIPAKKLPKAVAATIAAKYPEAKIKKVEEVVKFEDDEDDEKKFYEVVLASEKNGDVEVKLSPKGKILKDDDEDNDDDDDDKKKKNGQADDDKKGKSKGKDKNKKQDKD